MGNNEKNTVYEKNIEAIGVHLSRLAEKIDQELILLEQMPLEERLCIKKEIARDGNVIFKICTEGRSLYLNGKYEPEKEAAEWFEGLGKLNYESTVLLLGIGSGIYLKKLAENAEKNMRILIYEPSLEILGQTLQSVDLTEVFQERPIGLMIKGINESEFPIIIRRCINEDNLKGSRFFVHPNYKELFEQEIFEKAKECNVFFRELESYVNTKVRFTSVMFKNIMNNCRMMSTSSYMDQLCNMVPEEVPVIIVSAGPSLNKNIKDLKKAVGKAIIIATDTATKPLINAGIVPDLFVMVDAMKPVKLFEREEIWELPVISTFVSANEVLKRHKGKKIWFVDSSKFVADIYKRYNKHCTALNAGGSVATMAFSLSRFIGGRTIILVGQDLALTGNKSHADGTFEEKMEELKLDLNSDYYMEVEAVDGGTVISRQDFKLYLDWFETAIRIWTELKVIDATEGGALIHGAEILTLKEAIEKTCLTPYNFRQKLEELPPCFDEKEQEEIEEYLKQMPKYIKRVRNWGREGLRYYKQLEKLADRETTDVQEYRKLLKKIDKVRKKIEEDSAADLVMSVMQGIEYLIRENAYETEDSLEKETKMIARQGQLFCIALKKCADVILELLEKEEGKSCCE